MYNTVIKGLFLFFSILLTISTVVYAESNEPEQDINDEGTVFYHIKYDYDALSSFLKLSRDDYEKYWKEGLSIEEMAKKQGISRKDLEGYFISLHYNEMQKWRAKGPLTEKRYFELVYTLSEEIKDFIERNPNRKSN